MQARVETLGEYHPDTLTSMISITSLYQHQGRWEEADQLLEHVTEIKETMLDESHSDQLASQHDLAMAYQANGQKREAVELLEHVKINAS